MGVLSFDGVDDRIVWNTLATPLANTSDAAWTVAILLKRGHAGDFYESYASLRTAGANMASIGFQGAPGTINNLYIDVAGGAAETTTTYTSTTSPYMFVASKAGGASTPRVATKLGSGGAWTHTNFSATLADQAASTICSIGGNVLSGEFLLGWIGVVGWWEGAMSDTDKEALDNNWRTSDWYSSAHGTPTFLAECNVAAASVVDLIGNASSIAVTGTSLDAGETLDSWTFDGTGVVVAPLVMPEYFQAIPFFSTSRS